MNSVRGLYERFRQLIHEGAKFGVVGGIGFVVADGGTNLLQSTLHLGWLKSNVIATLAAGAGHRDGAQVTAAVLLYRAVTYLPPIPLGAIACLTWRHAPTLIHAKPVDAGQPTDLGLSGPDLAR